MSKNTKIYFNIEDDFAKYPQATVLVIVGGRGTGKTFSTLQHCYKSGKKFAFMKRTDRDVDMMCPLSINAKHDKACIDVSPFKKLNMLNKWNVRAFKVAKGLGGFWKCTNNNEPVGDPIGYIVSLYSISKLTGADFSDCSYEIFDEFIPRQYETTKQTEGEQVIEFYRTIERSSRIDGGDGVKIILLANSLTVGSPMARTLEITNDLVDMQKNNEEIRMLEDRSILIHRLPDIEGFREIEMQDPIYKVMHGTKWAEMSLNNTFAYDDFTYIGKQRMKGMRCIARVHWNNKYFFIYTGENGTYVTMSRSNNYDFDYDLERDGEQQRFYLEQVFFLREDLQDDRIRFETYELYDMFINYRKLYKI